VERWEEERAKQEDVLKWMAKVHYKPGKDSMDHFRKVKRPQAEDMRYQKRQRVLLIDHVRGLGTRGTTRRSCEHAMGGSDQPPGETLCSPTVQHRQDSAPQVTVLSLPSFFSKPNSFLSCCGRA
jgi:hypothetical protein